MDEVRGWRRPDRTGRAKREAVRLRAAEWFAQTGGVAALASKGPGGSARRLDDQRLARLAQALEEGPAAHGFEEDQRWTLARVADLIARLFHVHYTLRGVSYLLHRMGFSPQIPAHRAVERDEQARHHVAAGGVAGGKTVAAERGAWLCFEDEAGQTLHPAKARTWGRRGRTPVVAVSGKGSGRVSIAGLVCVRAGERSRLICRSRTHRGRKGERRSFAEADYAALLDAAHQQLGSPIVLIWDNLNTHRSAVMRELIAARDWLHVIRLPAYAPDLNPAEHVWSHVKRGLGNLIVHGIDGLVAVVKNRLKRIQYRPELIDAFFAHTGLELDAEPL